MSLLPEPLRIRQFRFFWLARLVWTIGSLSMVIVIGWQVYDIARQTMGLKEAAFRLGIIGLVQFIPLFLLTLVTGWTADRLDRRWIARAAVALELGCASALGWLAWTQHVAHPAPLALRTWLAFGYVTLFSQFIGFFAWYAGLAMGGIARVGQVQLLQIFFTIAFSALLFGEVVTPSTWLFAAAVIATVMLGRRSAVATAPRAARAG